MTALPTFKSPFLNAVCRRLETRGKALKHKGALTWSSQQPDEFEWISLHFAPLVGHSVVLQLVEDNRASVFVRRRSRNQRGKILLELPDINLVDNATAIVDAFETTIEQSSCLDTDDRLAIERIEAAWSRARVQVI